MIRNKSIRKSSLITFFLILWLLLITLFPVAAAVDPAWFNISMTQAARLARGSYRIQWTGDHNINMGSLKLSPKNKNIPNEYRNHTWEAQIRFLCPNNEVRLTKIGDPTKYFDLSLSVDINNINYTIDSSPTDVFGSFNSNHINTNFTLAIAGRSGSDAGYTGTYTASFKVQIFIRDPESPYEMVLVKEEVYNILAWYNSTNQSPIEDPIFSHLILDRYTNADAIDVEYLKNNNLSLLVGAVTLLTNDSNNSHSYTLNVVPTYKSGQPQPGGDFTFYHQGNNNDTFKYRVFANGRTQPNQGAFSVDAPDKGPADFWQDWVELGICGLNYTNETVGSGSYSSTIRIELTTNY